MKANFDQRAISDSLCLEATQEAQVSILVDSLMNTDRVQHEGGEDIEVEDDVDNIDFNNYKGIYADDDAGQKYTCPLTGAHFEPRDLCKRLYKVIDKRKPLEYELYGQCMLLDGVGSSLIAEAPYAYNSNDPKKVRISSGLKSNSQTRQ